MARSVYTRFVAHGNGRHTFSLIEDSSSDVSPSLTLCIERGLEVLMRQFACLIGILTVWIWAPTAVADIYSWSDENGILHFTNRNPPPEAELFLKTKEGPYEEAVARAQTETAAQRELRRAQDEAREQEERLAEKAAELERRTEEANRKAEEALARAEELAEAANRGYTSSRGYALGYAYYPLSYGYRYYGYNRYGYGSPYYSRKRYKKHSYRHHEKQKRYGKSRPHYREHRYKSGRYERYRYHYSDRPAYKGHGHRGRYGDRPAYKGHGHRGRGYGSAQGLQRGGGHGRSSGFRGGRRH